MPANLTRSDSPRAFQGSHPEASVYQAAAEQLVNTGRLAVDDLTAALWETDRTNSDLPDTLTAKGVIRPFDFYQIVADICGLKFADLRIDPVDETLVNIDFRADYSKLQLLPWRADASGKVLIATPFATDEKRAWADLHYGRDCHKFVITAPFDIQSESNRLFSEWDSYVAREALNIWKPAHSAKEAFTRPQILALLTAIACFIFALVFDAHVTLVVLMNLATVFYCLTFIFKFALTWIGASRSIDIDISSADLASLQEAALPTYTVLVPMYREKAVLPLLAKALQNLDYPSSKLRVKLVLEEDDVETIEAAKKLGLPRNFVIVRVPASYPKTKPKACNYALQFCRSTFVTIYDAEDQPEPDQLKKAVVAFSRSDKKLACVQARLNYFNRNDNWLTRMFTLEYSQWFDFLLPGLDWLKIPIPLGGTSNHFRLSALRAVGAWDPYNVTEDADLGVRFAQEGFTVGVINSTTFEEANGILPSWIRQRSRWIKGYMQTWLVHMRNPVALWRSIGPLGFFGFQFFIGGPPLIMLLNPLMWTLAISFFVFNDHAFGWLFPEPFGKLALFNLFVGNSLLIYFGVVAALKRRYYDLVPVGLMAPFYWVLHSIAAYKAALQLIRNPHYWEKTEHGTSAVTKHRLANADGKKAER
jgi:glycosyltransferase XagB